MAHIVLSNGIIATIDDDNLEDLSKYNWHMNNARGKPYAMRHKTIDGKKCVIFMHRQILQPKKNLHVDHINGDGLDNRLSNLRVATHSQNQMNRFPKPGKFKGVTLYKPTGRYFARITVAKKPIYLGFFEKAEDAAKAYDKAATRYFKEYARTNF